MSISLAADPDLPPSRFSPRLEADEHQRVSYWGTRDWLTGSDFGSVRRLLRDVGQGMRCLGSAAPRQPSAMRFGAAAIGQTFVGVRLTLSQRLVVRGVGVGTIEHSHAPIGL